MKKKELLDNISSIIKGEENQTETKINSLGLEFYEKIFKVNFVHVIVYSVFLILSLLLFHKIDHLAFVTEEFYVLLVTGFILFSLIISIIFFTLYIYNIDKKKLITLKELKSTNVFYQIFDILSFIFLFLTTFLWILLFVVTPVEVSGASMENTFHENDKILVWHVGYKPNRDDVVIIDGEGYYTNIPFVIKRVVAEAGDTVYFAYDNEVGYIMVNGEKIAIVSYEEFRVMMTDLSTNTSYDSDGIVPEGFSIVLGDNRNNSQDSKSIGLVKNEDIIGVVFFRIYPFEVLGIPEKNCR